MNLLRISLLARRLVFFINFIFHVFRSLVFRRFASWRVLCFRRPINFLIQTCRNHVCCCSLIFRRSIKSYFRYPLIVLFLVRVPTGLDLRCPSPLQGFLPSFLNAIAFRPLVSQFKPVSYRNLRENCQVFLEHSFPLRSKIFPLRGSLMIPLFSEHDTQFF